MTFLDVGQGDATVAILPEGGAVVVDCPAGSAPLVVDHLERAQVSMLELVVITHSDLDHAGGVVDVIKGFQGQTQTLVVLPDRVRKADPQADRRYRLLLRDLAQLLRAGIEYLSPYPGDVIPLGGAEVSILHPSPADRLEALSRGSPNDCSVVLKLECSETRILLGADVQRQGWQWMIERSADLKADVFRFPHHGAWYEGEPALGHVLDLVDPTMVVISVGSTNGYGHPSMETFRLLRSRGIKVRFACTQATSRCHRDLEAIAPRVRGLLPIESQGGHSFQNRQTCPCAGSVAVRISGDVVATSPTLEQHDRVIDLFDEPQCRM